MNESVDKPTYCSTRGKTAESFMGLVRAEELFPQPYARFYEYRGLELCVRHDRQV